MSKIMKKSVALLAIVCLLFGGCSTEEHWRKKKKIAEGSELLEGSWVVHSLVYNNREYELSENESLASLYENIFLTFSDDGIFSYFNLYSYNGIYEAMAEDTFMLKTEMKHNIDIESGEVMEEKVEKYYIVTVLEDGRLRFAEMDEVTGAEKTDDMPKIFSKQ